MTDIHIWMEQRRAEDERLYEQYGKPLEEAHWGSLIAIGPDGAFLFGEDSDRLFVDAVETRNW